jgi:predicted DNA-binding transcriptional regulator AlpA
MIEQVKNFDELPAVISVWPGLGNALGVSRSTAYKIVKQDGFPAIRISPKKIVVPKAQLLQFLGQSFEAKSV